VDEPGYVVATEDHGAVRVFVLDRPRKLNAFTAEGYRVLRTRLQTAASDPAVAVCVLTGRGRAFSSGVDMAEMGRPGGKEELGEHFDPLLDCLAHFPKPLVAAVNGLAVGFGATLLLHCDVVLADRDAVIRMPFVSLGTCAEAASSWLLPRRVGAQRAAWMVLSGTAVAAEEAVAAGLVLATTAPGAVLDDALTLAASMATSPVPALVANKALLRHGWGDAVIAAWQRERAAMVAIAEELGSIGWSRSDRADVAGS